MAFRQAYESAGDNALRTRLSRCVDRKPDPGVEVKRSAVLGHAYTKLPIALGEHRY